MSRKDRENEFQELLTELNKKDDDINVISAADGVLHIETTLDFGEDDGEENLEESPEERIVMDIAVKIVRNLFMINALTSLAIFTGFIPYHFLVYDERNAVDVKLFIGSAAMFLLAYILMAVFHKKSWSMVTLVVWIVTFYLTSITLASVLQNLVPLQFSMITFVQSIGMIVYTTLSPSYVNHWHSFYIMLILGLVGWGIGLYAFVTEQDWISAVVLLFITMLISGYYALETKLATRFSLSQADMTESVVRLYTDPILLIKAHLMA